MGREQKRQLTRKQISRRVGLVRGVMKIAARQMVDLDRAVGEIREFPADKGPVRALVYGFEDRETRPLLVNIHGSGFVMGSAAMDDPFMMQFVERCGVKVISIDYPLSPDVMFPTALEQCHALVRYAKQHAGELGIDGDRIMLMGHSAGGNFCAAIGLMEQRDPVLGLRGMILDYPPTDLTLDPGDKPQPKGCLPPRLCRIFDAAYCTPEQRSDPLVSPALATPDMVRGFPPVMIITAGRDSLAPETERLKDTLIEAGVDVTFRRFEDAIHGFTVITEKQGKKRPALYRQSLEAWKMMREFVIQHLETDLHGPAV